MLGYRQRRRPIVRDFTAEDLQAELSGQDHIGLVHRPTGIRVELHHALSVPQFAGLLSAQDALDHAISISAKEMMFSVLAPTDRIVHHVLHAHLHHPYLHYPEAQNPIVELRQLVDLAILVDAFGSDIDWTDVGFRFSSNGYANVLADYLAYLALLLDRRVPAHISDLKTVTVRLRAGVEAPPADKSQDTAGAIAAEYWKRLRRRPALAINLIDPFLWPETCTQLAKSPEAKLSPTRTCKTSRPPSNAAAGAPERGCTLAKAFRLVPLHRGFDGLKFNGGLGGPGARPKSQCCARRLRSA